MSDQPTVKLSKPAEKALITLLAHADAAGLDAKAETIVEMALGLLLSLRGADIAIVDREQAEAAGLIQLATDGLH